MHGTASRIRGSTGYQLKNQVFLRKKQESDGEPVKWCNGEMVDDEMVDGEMV